MIIKNNNNNSYNTNTNTTTNNNVCLPLYPGEYVAAFRENAQDPLNSLCIGLVFTHMACQKFAAKRHALTVQACAFLNQYLELRGECQESYYNLGRAMHQLGKGVV